MKKIIFGTGVWGKYAINEYGSENIAYLVDNDSAKLGKYINEIEIIQPEKLRDICCDDDYEIVIAIKYGKEVAQQLENMGITNYKFYNTDTRKVYPTSELIVNPYKIHGGMMPDSSKFTERIKTINDKVDELSKKNELFNCVELETHNRCNGGCRFCPVNRHDDTREYKKMSDELFHKIIDELGNIEYDGRISLYSNDEPFMDERIVEFQKYAREHVPHAYFYMFTNGTLLTLDKFIDIIPYLDEMVIDNYNQELQLIPTVKAIVGYCEEHSELKNKVTVVLRKVDEVLTNRGGSAPNAKPASYPDVKCVLPFEQIVIRPDGKTSLCCNDPLGKSTLADLNKETLVEAWNNDNYKNLRKAMRMGRKEYKQCEHCDVFMMGW